MKKQITNLTAAMKQHANAGAFALCAGAQRVKAKLAERDGQFVMDHAVVFVLIIVLGGISLVLLTTFLQNDMATVLKAKIMQFFN